MRTVTVAGLPVAEADEMAQASGSNTAMTVAVSARGIRRDVSMSHPFPRGLVGLLVGGRSPGSRAHHPRLPDSQSDRSVAALMRRGWHPRSQWRVRAGFAPTSLDHRPYELGHPTAVAPVRQWAPLLGMASALAGYG